MRELRTIEAENRELRETVVALASTLHGLRGYLAAHTDPLNGQVYASDVAELLRPGLDRASAPRQRGSIPVQRRGLQPATR